MRVVRGYWLSPGHGEGMSDIHLASAGEVTSRTYSRLGYQRLTRGVYGRAPTTEGMDLHQRRRAEFLARTRAVMARYGSLGAVLFGPTAFQVLNVALPQTLEDWDTCHILLPPGAARVRRALRWVRSGTDSLYETRLRLVVVRAGLPEPAVNLPVRCATSSVPFHLDLGFEAEKVGLEYDGAVHVGNREQMEFDARRRRLLQDDGWLIITVTAAQLRAPAQVIASVEQALALRRAAVARAW